MSAVVDLAACPARMEQEQPELVIVHDARPHGDAASLVRRLRSDARSPDVVVVVLSADGDTAADRTAALEKSGRDVTVEARWTLMRTPKGEPENILAIETDVTSRKMLELQFLRAQRMESIGTLLSTMPPAPAAGHKSWAKCCPSLAVSRDGARAGTNPSVTRSYNGFRQLADEESYSRIWGGIHFLFETLSSLGSCTQLGDYAADDVLRRR